MFNESKYTKWYYQIISNAKERDKSSLTESHHIIPKSLGGENHKENLINLTYKEHFICHLLLTKMTYGANKLKMDRAFWLMKNINQIDINSSLYQKAKENYRKACSGPKNWSKKGKERLREAAKNRTGHKNGFYGKKHNEQTKEENRRAHLGKKWSSKEKEMMSGENSYRFQGYYHTPWGIFPSSSLAEKNHDYLKANTINNWCKNSHLIVKKIGKSKFLKSIGPNCIGKTYRELGFNFQPKQP